MAEDPIVDPALRAFVAGLGLAGPGAAQSWRPLSGGVSCDVWRVEVGEGAICVKRALARLNVADDWRAPIGRVLYEARWFETARSISPAAAPEPLAVDAERGFLATAFLPPEVYPLWKGQLLAGRVEAETARAVGERLGSIHAATAGRADIAARFDAEGLFFALRLEPYLLAAAARNPELAAAIEALAARTAGTRTALMHGDVSPKNILVGPDGPVYLDAETACWGDPAFDLAFCLNHLLLKQLVVPNARGALQDAFAAFSRAYFGQVDWEPREQLEARAASLLPALLLARIDGKSPVEYLTKPAQRAIVRAVATPLLRGQPSTLHEVADAWRDAMAAAG
jgi:aminoglycoside phosphotransferase (APT) family kinase protein